MSKVVLNYKKCILGLLITAFASASLSYILLLRNLNLYLMTIGLSKKKEMAKVVIAYEDSFEAYLVYFLQEKFKTNPFVSPCFSPPRPGNQFITIEFSSKSEKALQSKSHEIRDFESHEPIKKQSPWQKAFTIGCLINIPRDTEIVQLTFENKVLIKENLQKLISSQSTKVDWPQ